MEDVVTELSRVGDVISTESELTQALSSCEEET